MSYRYLKLKVISGLKAINKQRKSMGQLRMDNPES
jgi:hypothetical protein